MRPFQFPYPLITTTLHQKFTRFEKATNEPLPFFLCSGAKRQEVSFWQNNTKNPSVASLSSQFRSSTGLIYRYTWYAQTDIDMAFRYRCNTHVLRNYKRYNIRWSRLLYIYICIYIFGSHSFIFILCSTFFDVHTLRRLSFVRQWHLPCLRCRMEGSILLKLSCQQVGSFPIRFLFSLYIDRIHWIPKRYPITFTRSHTMLFLICTNAIHSIEISFWYVRGARRDMCVNRFEWRKISKKNWIGWMHSNPSKASQLSY